MDCNLYYQNNADDNPENHTILNNNIKSCNEVDNNGFCNFINSRGKNELQNCDFLNQSDYNKNASKTHIINNNNNLNYCFTPTNYPLMDIVHLKFNQKKT